MRIEPDMMAIGGLGVLSIALLLVGLLRTTRQDRLSQRLQLLVPRNLGIDGGLDDAGMQRRGVLGRLNGLLFAGAADRVEVVAKLRAAGYYDAATPSVFGLIRLCVALLAAGTCAVAVLQRGPFEGMTRAYPAIAFVAGFVGAKFVLGWRVSVRQHQLRRELPFALDLLLLMLESGVGLDQCFRQMAQVDGGALRRMRPVNMQLVDDLQNGMSYEVALDRWADRLAVSGVRELASLFRQSLLFGTELGPALHVFVAEFSDKRISAARESIGRKTTQMTIVMILFLLPALFVVLIGPAAVSLSQAFK